MDDVVFSSAVGPGDFLYVRHLNRNQHRNHLFGLTTLQRPANRGAPTWKPHLPLAGDTCAQKDNKFESMMEIWEK